jgi:hypothetical protein
MIAKIFCHPFGVLEFLESTTLNDEQKHILPWTLFHTDYGSMVGKAIRKGKYIVLGYLLLNPEGMLLLQN